MPSWTETETDFVDEQPNRPTGMSFDRIAEVAAACRKTLDDLPPATPEERVLAAVEDLTPPEALDILRPIVVGLRAEVREFNRDRR